MRLDGTLATASITAPALPDDLADIYRAKVDALVTSLNAPEMRAEATEAIWGLVERIVVHWNDGAKTHGIEIEGQLAALLTLAQNKNAAAFEAAASSLKLVAGAGFEPATFRL